MATRLRLLGSPQVFDGAEWFVAPHDKRFALLAFLARAGKPVPRERLAFLFWPDVEEARARRDLRHLIYRTKSLTFATGLEVGSESLAWRIETDVASFEQAVAQREWSAAVELYRGQFMSGMHLDSSPEFMSWLELERQAGHDLWRNAISARAAELEAATRYDEAAGLLKELMGDDALDEEALRHYLRNCALAGRSEEAKRFYRRFERQLATDMGLEPLPATKAAAAVLHGTTTLADSGAGRDTERVLRSGPRRVGHVRNLPAEATPFVGRETELTAIVDLLEHGSCRLLTLVGPGGIGKTRLAQAAARHVSAHYSDGSAFVALAAVDKAPRMVPAVTGALGLSFYDQREPQEQLSGYLQDKELLLVLDNLEQLPDAADLIADLLEACPRLKLVVTSRQRLNLTQEWLFRVTGMRLTASTGSTAVEGDAAQFFLRCARRVRHDFVLGQSDRADVVNICQLVGGAPLGIELAAGWLEMLTCKEIASTMAVEGLDFLMSTLHDVPARHRSMRDVFEHSWRFLDTAERTAFAGLSVFRTGFTRPAAEVVTGIDSRHLRSLMEKSLVTRTPGGRFELHELARQYAAERLSESGEREAAVRSSHCAHFSSFLNRREQALRGGAQETALGEIDQELDNVRGAWEWAVTRADLEALDSAAGGLRTYYQTRGLFREGEEAFRQAATAFMQESQVSGRLTLYQALFTYWLGKHAEARDIAQRSLATLQRHAAAPGILANANFLLGLVQRDLGELDIAGQRFTEALALARQAGEQYFEARSLQGLGRLAEIQGSSQEAERFYRQSIAVFQDSQDRYGLALASFNLGGILATSGRLEQARECYLVGLQAGKAVGSLFRIAEALILLGRLSQQQGGLPQAEAHYAECLATVAGRDDEPFRLAAKHCHVGLGETAAASHRFAESFLHFRRALSLSVGTTDAHTAYRSLVGMAVALAGLGADGPALTLLTYARAQMEAPAGDPAALQLEERLTSRLSTDEMELAGVQGRTLGASQLASLLDDWQATLVA